MCTCVCKRGETMGWCRETIVSSSLNTSLTLQPPLALCLFLILIHLPPLPSSTSALPAHRRSSTASWSAYHRYGRYCHAFQTGWNASAPQAPHIEVNLLHRHDRPAFGQKVTLSTWALRTPRRYPRRLACHALGVGASGGLASLRRCHCHASTNVLYQASSERDREPKALVFVALAEREPQRIICVPRVRDH